MTKFEEIKRVSVSDTVGERIMAMITQGRIKPGERLPSESELMRQLKVGRSSVREAVHGLVMMGVLDSKPRRGTIVISPVANGFGELLRSSIAIWGLKDLFDVRLLLEERAAGAAAENATEDEIAAIERCAEAVERKVTAGKSYFVENRDFHLSIAKASHNRVLVDCLRSIIGNLRGMRENINSILREMPRQDVREHRAIVEAIRRRDAKSARRIMRTHISVYIRKIAARAAQSSKI